nr:Putative uncharacterized protein [Moritella viscosa]SHO11315.1 Putative uncharacterized protein [Moritella viscosa]SHO17883.1 Putative uncharacterized protein [Moritella viscosa]
MRLNNRTPILSSKTDILLLTADFVIPSLSAADEKLPFSTTATNTGIAEKSPFILSTFTHQ